VSEFLARSQKSVEIYVILMGVCFAVPGKFYKSSTLSAEKACDFWACAKTMFLGSNNTTLLIFKECLRIVFRSTCKVL
jgi:hypothetical protein